MQITKFIPANRHDVFDAFIKPQKIEKWAYPQGMSLKVPRFEAHSGGEYQYIHLGQDGDYNCVGHIESFIPDEKLEMIDERITGPDGKILMENLPCKISFRDKTGGTEVTVIQTGFKDKKTEQECEQGWADSLNQLAGFLEQDAPYRQRPGLDESARL